MTKSRRLDEVGVPVDDVEPLAGGQGANRSLWRTSTRSATPCRSTLRRVFSTAAELMSKAVTRRQPASAALTAVTPVPEPISSSVPPTGYGIQAVNSSVTGV